MFKRFIISFVFLLRWYLYDSREAVKTRVFLHALKPIKSVEGALFDADELMSFIYNTFNLKKKGE